MTSSDQSSIYPYSVEFTDLSALDLQDLEDYAEVAAGARGFVQKKEVALLAGLKQCELIRFSFADRLVAIAFAAMFGGNCLPVPTVRAA